LAATSAAAVAQKAENTARVLVSAAIAKRLSINGQRQSIQAEVTKQKALLATLTAAQLNTFVNAGAPTPQQKIQIVNAPVPAPSKAAGTAVNAALAEQGKPYVWGAAGPDSFDCSGLTMWAWGKAGVSLPHNAASQQSMGTPVPQSQLAPGDLVFFGSPAYHVGMYIGNGMMVHAPTSGENVKVVSLSSMSDYAGASRFG
jgi:cell wall-associated NlpC family hydrolase